MRSAFKMNIKTLQAQKWGGGPMEKPLPPGGYFSTEYFWAVSTRLSAKAIHTAPLLEFLWKGLYENTLGKP